MPLMIKFRYTGIFGKNILGQKKSHMIIQAPMTGMDQLLWLNTKRFKIPQARAVEPKTRVSHKPISCFFMGSTSPFTVEKGLTPLGNAPAINSFGLMTGVLQRGHFFKEFSNLTPHCTQ